MDINALGYIGIRSTKLDDWSDFASRLLGMQAVDRGPGVRAFRMDDRKQRLIVSADEAAGATFMGWEAENTAALERIAASLDAANIAVERGTKSLCEARFVSDLIWFNDPDGNRLEVFTGGQIADDDFVPGRPITGFRTGPQGMGHAVLHVADVDGAITFYRDTLGFRVSDYFTDPYTVMFFHVNARHHSFALIGSGQTGFHHFMVEFNHLDDVGQGFDIATEEEGRIAYTLGRHTNDWMTSFYANTPDGFFVESGWGGRIIDPDTWEPHETNMGPSFWGHERHYLDPEQRRQMKKMALRNGREGIQAPPIVDCPFFYGGKVG